jgi:uncharacterized protein HemY
MRGDSSRLEPRHRKPQVPKIAGAFYMSVVDEMRYLGLDPAIVSVHLASDNLASGHAALARKAVMICLDQVGSDFGHEELDRHWRRVSLGCFESSHAGPLPRY